MYTVVYIAHGYQGATNHWTLDWTGILKFVFMLRGMKSKSNHSGVD